MSNTPRHEMVGNGLANAGVPNNGAAKRPFDAHATIDPLTAEVIIHGLCAIPNLIDKNITRTAFSILISEYKDYAVGIVDASGRLVTQSKGGLPIFVANALCAAVNDGLEIYGKAKLQHGDVVISNHAGTMGQHLNNVVMYTPIRTDETDEGLVGFLAIVMHWIDIGGIVVGSCSSNDTTDIFQEGIQFHTVKVLARGERVEEMYRMIAANTRFPVMVLGDMESQVSGCLVGRDMVLDLVAKHGQAAIDAAIHLFWDKSEAAVRTAIARLPRGVYRAKSFLDDDGITKGKPIPIEVEVRIEGDSITIDFSKVADQMAGPLNAGFSGGAIAAARIACKYVFSPDDPANDGAFRPINVVCPPGKFLSAQPPAALSGSGSMIPSVVDTILRALADTLPERIPAAHHGTYGIHMIYGRVPAENRWYQHMEAAIGGWGAARDRDGPGPYRSNLHGDTLEVPVELQEASYPYQVGWSRLRQDSGGAGAMRGGLGVEKCYRITVPGRLWSQIERTQCPPWGLQGGHAAQTGYVEVHRDGNPPMVITKDDIELLPGDEVRVFTAGGGGYGEPLKRDVARVLADVQSGYVSREVAERDYGVVIDANECVDAANTAARRTRQ
ncbi:MAG: hydantoinase B/oxoprolinase family protein [Burkholderiales bacterium]